MIQVFKTSKGKYILARDDDIISISIKSNWISGTTTVNKSVSIRELLTDGAYTGLPFVSRTYVDSWSHDHILHQLQAELRQYGCIVKRVFKGAYNG